MTKLLVIADPHLRYKESLGDDRKNYKLNRLMDIVKIVVSSPDIIGLCILGDLFENPNPNEELRKTFFQIMSPLFKYNKYLIFIAGNHDSTATHHCFSGDSFIPYEYTKIFTGTEIKEIQLPGFENFVAVSWYSSLNQNEFYDKCAGKFVLGHLEVQGATMNNDRECDRGITQHLLEQNKTRVLTGHFHKGQDGKNYSYLGALFRGNFGEVDYETCYGLLDSDFNLTRHTVVDWNFITIKEEDQNWKKDYSYFGDEPVAVKFVTKKSLRQPTLMRDVVIKNELGRLGIKNIRYFIKQILSEKMKVEAKNDVILEGSTVESLITFSRINNDFGDLEENLLRRWLHNANFETTY